MSDAWLLIVAAILIVAVPFDVYAAIKIVRAAMEKPYLRILTLAALRSVAIVIAAVIFAILGAQAILFTLTGTRIFPASLSALLIAIAAVVISLPNVYALRWLRESDKGNP